MKDYYTTKEQIIQKIKDEVDASFLNSFIMDLINEFNMDEKIVIADDTTVTIYCKNCDKELKILDFDICDGDIIISTEKCEC